ncbi:MAG TPA: calcium/proton exchanger [Roseiflexaceae bacterium]|nr:calcium/proton exchanger [Roseiflexaceae bacterium]
MIFKYALIFVPVSLILAYVIQVPPLWIFASAIIAIVPLAEWIRRATEQIANRVGSAIGGLLNVSFGNATELILAFFVLAEGKTAVVKGQITGSIIGNGLLGLGLAILIGTWGRDKQTFKRERAGQLGSLLILAVIALLLPALFNYTEQSRAVADASQLDEYLSLGVSVVLIIVYIANLVYTLFTHSDVFAADEDEGEQHADWSLWKAIGVLVGATVVTAIEAELVSGALEATADKLGLTPFFLGVVVLAIIGNAAEYVSAMYFARQNRMGIVMTTTVGSSIQVALLVAPLLVLGSYVMGKPMDLVFNNTIELIAIAGVAFAVNAIAQDGETTWFEGLLLIAVYILLGMAFFFVTP